MSLRQRIAQVIEYPHHISLSLCFNRNPYSRTYRRGVFCLCWPGPINNSYKGNALNAHESWMGMNSAVTEDLGFYWMHDPLYWSGDGTATTAHNGNPKPCGQGSCNAVDCAFCCLGGCFFLIDETPFFLFLPQLCVLTHCRVLRFFLFFLFFFFFFFPDFLFFSFFPAFLP